MGLSGLSGLSGGLGAGPSLEPHPMPHHALLTVTNNEDGTATAVVKTAGQVPEANSWVLLRLLPDFAGIYQVISQDSDTQFTVSGSPASFSGGYWSQESGGD